MITIIHGDDTASSRNYFLDLRSQQKENYSFDGKKLELISLVQVIHGGSLFQTEKNIFIEDLILGRKDSKEKDEITDFLIKNAKNTSVFLWEGKDISKLKNNLVKNTTQKTFNFPQMLFTFLDSIKPHSKQNIVHFHEALQKSDEQLLFTMLLRQIRLLMGVTNESANPIEEVKRLAPWQESKLQKQARLFSTNELKKAHHKLFEIDLAQKTGTTSLSLSKSIDFFLLSL